MNMPSNPHRVASRTLTKLPNLGITTLPRLWLDLPAETRQQIAWSFALLLLRMRSPRAPIKADRHVESIE
jgi:hypothetical protein